MWAKSTCSENELLEYVLKTNNLPSVLPEQVVNVTSDCDNLSFTIQGMGSIALQVTKREPNCLIQLSPVGKTPFQFVLNVYIRDNKTTSQQDNESECCFEIDAQLNPLMQMMASRPLQNLVDMMCAEFEKLRN